jgi:hypothetical protein
LRKYLRAAALSAVALAIPVGSAVVVTAPAVAATAFRPPAAMVRVFHNNVKSSNWSGYAVSGATFSDVVGTWTEPTAKCTSGTEYASFWVGIDGYSSDSVEQLGTDSDCNGSKPSYYGWYEMYPANSVDLGGKYAIKAGDVMTAEVKVTGSSFVLSMKDATAGWTFSITKTGSSSLKRSSAEWVIESPEICSTSCKLAKLADFGKLTFSNCEAATTGADGAISSFTGAKGPHKMTMTGTPKTVIRSVPSALTSNGEGFTTTWKHS